MISTRFSFKRLFASNLSFTRQEQNHDGCTRSHISRVLLSSRNLHLAFALMGMLWYGPQALAQGTPITSCPSTYNCGKIPDGCGGTVTCGTTGGICEGTTKTVCGGNGFPNVCGAKGTTCTPMTCAQLGDNCGGVSDGCSAVLSCGTCSAPDTCGVPERRIFAARSLGRA